MENGIYIPSFLGDDKDNELERVLPFLLTLKDVKDVRVLVRKFAGVLRLYKMFTTERIELGRLQLTAREEENDEIALSPDHPQPEDGSEMPEVGFELEPLAPTNS